MRYEDNNITIDELKIESLQDAIDLIDFSAEKLKEQFVAKMIIYIL